MTTAIGITLRVGVGLGVVLGFPAGRAWERVRPRGDDAKSRRHEKKKR